MSIAIGAPGGLMHDSMTLGAVLVSLWLSGLPHATVLWPDCLEPPEQWGRAAMAALRFGLRRRVGKLAGWNQME
ncbi:hypothetical protein IQ216_02615 [Cyanobium sp. LEGE 06143]|nr:hypothetical protein [Cyanobium sp. LEGE 06143]